MAAKVILVLCAQALLLQVARGQCVRPAPACAPARAPAWSAAGCAGSGLALSGISVAPTSGGALPITSASSIAPIGLSVASENVFEGLLAAVGELPFVGTVALEGVLPTAGAGAVNHACGDGHVGMISGGAPGAYGPAGAYGLAGGAYGLAGGAYGLAGGAYTPAAAGYGIGAGNLGYGARSCGCGLY